MNNEIWLIGTGQMAMDYTKVLNTLSTSITIIGRSEEKCNEFRSKFDNKVVSGGVEKYLKGNPSVPQKVIIAANVEELQNICNVLINYGVKDILVEKPGVAEPDKIDALAELANSNGVNLLIAYNRRFYSSVLKAEEIIREDGGLSTFNFEFTEWAHVITPTATKDTDFHYWFLWNSTHVVDLAFFMGGLPKQLSAFHSGSLDWHPSAAAFAGAGISEKGALFSYQANWEAPGRWVVEMLTKKHRLIFKPMEKLQIQEIGSVAVNPVEINDTLDTEYKPGLYLQTKSFLEGDYSRFCDVHEQRKTINNIYNKMSGY